MFEHGGVLKSDLIELQHDIESLCVHERNVITNFDVVLHSVQLIADDSPAILEEKKQRILELRNDENDELEKLRYKLHALRNRAEALEVKLQQMQKEIPNFTELLPKIIRIKQELTRPCKIAKTTPPLPIEKQFDTKYVFFSLLDVIEATSGSILKIQRLEFYQRPGVKSRHPTLNPKRTKSSSCRLSGLDPLLLRCLCIRA